MPSSEPTRDLGARAGAAGDGTDPGAESSVAAAEQLLERFVYERGDPAATTAVELAAGLDADGERRRFLRLVERAETILGLFPARRLDGALLQGRYRLISELDAGGFGRVWLAADEQLGDRPVAVKVLGSALGRRGVRADLEREKSALARVEHPGVVRIHGVGEHDGSPFMVLDFVDGVTLRRVIDERARAQARGTPDDDAFSPRVRERIVRSRADDGGERPLDFQRVAAGIVHDLCDALAAAHAHGVVHRDLNPKNVMLAPGGRVVLLDFGLSGLRGRDFHSFTDRLAGTLQYLAPEQVAQRRLGRAERTDVYQAGVVLYELATAVSPFPATSGEEFSVMQRIRNGDFPSPRQVARDVPPALEDICLRAMERDPARRFESAAQMRDELAAFLAGSGRSRSSIARWSAAVRRFTVRRRTALVVAATLAVGLLVGAGAVFAGQPVSGIDAVAGLVRDGDRFVGTVAPSGPAGGRLFARAVVVDELGMPAALVPLVDSSERLWIESQGERFAVELRLPRRAELRAREPVRTELRIARGETAERLASFHRALLDWMHETGTRTGVPYDVSRRLGVELFASSPRGADGGEAARDEVFDELFGAEAWKRVATP